MKSLFIVLMLLFLFFGCAQPEKVIEKEIIVREGEQWLKISDERVKIFPNTLTAMKNFGIKSKIMLAKLLSNTSVFADAPAPVEESKALLDWNNGVIYAENSYTPVTSWKHNNIEYLDIGAEVGTAQRMLVNVVFEVTDYQANANPCTIYARPKGSNVAWTKFYPTLSTPDAELMTTDDQGVIEWHMDNTAPYDNIDPLTAAPGVHVYGHQTVAGYADGYCVFLGIR
jgi:hypothetical protein